MVLNVVNGEYGLENILQLLWTFFSSDGLAEVLFAEGTVSFIYNSDWLQDIYYHKSMLG